MGSTTGRASWTSASARRRRANRSRSSSSGARAEIAPRRRGRRRRANRTRVRARRRVERRSCSLSRWPRRWWPRGDAEDDARLARLALEHVRLDVAPPSARAGHGAHGGGLGEPRARSEGREATEEVPAIAGTRLHAVAERGGRRARVRRVRVEVHQRVERLAESRGGNRPPSNRATARGTRGRGRGTRSARRRARAFVLAREGRLRGPARSRMTPNRRGRASRPLDLDPSEVNFSGGAGACGAAAQSPIGSDIRFRCGWGTGIF